MDRPAGTPYRVAFTDPEGWETPADGVRSKRWTNGPVTIRLVEMHSSAAHPEWCTVGHSGSIVEGVLEVEFDDHVVRFEAGDGIAIPPGRTHRHRPRALSNRVRLALVDWSDPAQPTA